ncbi:MAG: LysE family transporter [Prochloraceae cyanobacterium]|nr:LysE family transporter [Prochloraceae cyanobacterium]
MYLSFFLKGLVIGISIAAPVGAIGILCIKQTLLQGRLVGFISGLGAATADGIYGCIAGFGLTFLSSFLIEQQFLFRAIGGSFLCYLGIKTFLEKPKSKEIYANKKSLASSYISTFLLTLTNPMTILSFTAIFAGLGLINSQANYSLAAIFVLGVFLGSASWWLLLSNGVNFFRKKFDFEKLSLLNRISGIIIISFGIAALFSLKI